MACLANILARGLPPCFAHLPSTVLCIAHPCASPDASASLSLLDSSPSPCAKSSSDDTFESEVIDHSKQGQPVLVDFTADWCGPCRMVEPLLADLDGAGAVKVVKAKPEHTETFRTWLKEQGEKYGIAGLPTIILFEKGLPARVHMGSFDAKKLASFVGDAAAQLVAPRPAPVPVPVRIDRQDAPHI